MRNLVKMSLCGLLMLPALNVAIAVEHSTAASGVAPLLAWALGPCGVWAGLGFLILGGIAGTPVGTPWPFLDGVALSACLQWLPGLCVGSPTYAQNAVAVLLLLWAVGFFTMFFRLVKPWREWDTFSFLELLFALNRIIRRKTKTAVSGPDSTR
jgi:hypothetical protein